MQQFVDTITHVSVITPKRMIPAWSTSTETGPKVSSAAATVATQLASLPAGDVEASEDCFHRPAVGELPPFSTVRRDNDVGALDGKAAPWSGVSPGRAQPRCSIFGNVSILQFLWIDGAWGAYRTPSTRSRVWISAMWRSAVSSAAALVWTE